MANPLWVHLCVLHIKGLTPSLFFPISRSFRLLISFFFFLYSSDLAERFQFFSSSKRNTLTVARQNKSASLLKKKKNNNDDCNNIPHRRGNPCFGLFNRRSLEWHTKQHHLFYNSCHVCQNVIHRSTTHGN